MMDFVNVSKNISSNNGKDVGFEILTYGSQVCRESFHNNTGREIDTSWFDN
jgi:hypothetical protein